jgi:hypothetical protein
MAEPLTETHYRLVPKVFFGSGDVRLGMFDVAGSRFRINRQDVFTRNLIDVLKHRVDGNAIAASDVENLPADTGDLACEQIRFDDVADIGEIA